jgi:predicted phosphohydrolase
MRVFAIGDMHLAGGTGKTMDRFGEHWRNHDQKIFSAWGEIGDPSDLLLICGDSSWAMRLADAAPDLARIGQMKGLKLILKGNHDYWWPSESKMKVVLDPSVRPINAASTIIDRVAVAGTRGWLCPNDVQFEDHDLKIYEREVGRLRLALSSLDGRRDQYQHLIVALHYPPTNRMHEPSGFTELIDKYKADACVYGHLHGSDIATALTGKRGVTTYHVVSADAVDFAPAEIRLSTHGVSGY